MWDRNWPTKVRHSTPPLPHPSNKKKVTKKQWVLLVNEGAMSQINNCVCLKGFFTCFFFLDFFSNFYALLKMTLFLLKNKTEIINSYLKLTIVCCSGICTITRGSLRVRHNTCSSALHRCLFICNLPADEFVAARTNWFKKKKIK